MSREFSKKDIPPTIALACIILPVLSGFNTFGLGYYGWIVVSSAASAFAVYRYHPQRPILSACSGMVMGLGVFMAAQWYFRGRSSYFEVEFLVPLALGIIPGVLLFLAGKAFIKVPAPTQSPSIPSNDDTNPKRTADR